MLLCCIDHNKLAITALSLFLLHKWRCPLIVSAIAVHLFFLCCESFIIYQAVLRFSDFTVGVDHSYLRRFLTIYVHARSPYFLLLLRAQHLIQLIEELVCLICAENAASQRVFLCLQYRKYHVFALA